MVRAGWWLSAWLLLGPGVAWSAPADAPDPDEPVSEASGAPDPMLDWYSAWAHVVRLDVSPGRYNGRDLGAGGLGMQWEWWPTELLAYTSRIFMQTISIEPDWADWRDGMPAERQAAGMTMGLQVGTPGPVKLVAGAAVGVAFVNGRLPPSDRWRVRPVPTAGVLNGYAGVALLARPVTVHAYAQVHLYSEGPAVYSLSLGGGPMLRPQRDGATSASDAR